MMVHDTSPNDADMLRDANEQLVMSVLRSQAFSDVLQARYAQVIGRIAEAVVETDDNHRITAFSQGAATLYGWTESDAIGRLRDEVMPSVGHNQAIELSRTDAVQWVDSHRRRNGDVFDVAGTTIALCDEAGVVTGYLHVIQDVTASHVADELAGEMEIARQIQSALLPLHPPTARGWKVVWRLQPQRLVGGDLVTFVEVGGRVRYLVADVTGKGISAALSVRNVHQVFHDTARFPLAAAVRHLNRALSSVRQIQSGVTCVMLEFESGSGLVRVCNAGHPLPLVWRASGSPIEECSHSNMVAGWYPDTDFVIDEVELSMGDRLLVYTDGLSDAPVGDDERIDEHGVKAMFADSASGPLEKVADRLLSAATQPTQIDDVTLLLIERLAD